MTGIIDYSLGNVKAFAHIFHCLGAPYSVVSDARALAKVSRIILPGVGAFDHAMQRLQQSGMREALDEAVLARKTPVLGVCVGMQMLTARSEEGVCPGLGWIGGEVVKLRRPPSGHALEIPHMGWNDVEPVNRTPLFRGLEGGARFYFLHSYYACCARDEDILARTTYGAPFSCAIGSGNVYGVQFHPEKSHQAGIQLLKNFAEL